jgi:hypothetical protein
MALAAPAAGAATSATCARDAPRARPPARAPAAAAPPPPRRRRLAAAARAPAARAAAASASFAVAAGGEIAEVGDLKGIRVSEAPPPPAEAAAEAADGATAAAAAGAAAPPAAPPPRRPLIEYLVEWKDGSPDTWEPAANLADDLLRDFEQRWWAAVRKGDDAVVDKLMDGGGATLARTVDAERRSALHFAAALGRAPLARRLLAKGADANLADKDGALCFELLADAAAARSKARRARGAASPEIRAQTHRPPLLNRAAGYTPLHMAAGYMHTSTIAALLEGGADPEQADRKGRSPLELVESLRARLPPGGDPGAVARRVALEDVSRGGFEQGLFVIIGLRALPPPPPPPRSCTISSASKHPPANSPTHPPTHPPPRRSSAR